ncbi:MAG: transporter substrate-binding domain-containing protein [Actinobacteria bacterium]|nr:MAG: transporter substrate-binding domain-containing protein [Actinomycetota bacterium]
MSRNRLALLAVAAAVVATAASIGAVASTAAQTTRASASPTVIKMGIEPWIGYGPWWIVISKGYDRKHGVQIKSSTFTTDADINTAFAAHRIDAENLATHTGVRFLGSGVKLKFVLFEDVSLTADAILAGPNIRSVKDLKGKKVAYEEGTTSDLLLRYALAKNGMSIKDIKVVPIPAADAGAAAIAGKVDAAVTYEPYLTAALKQGKGFHLIYTAGKRPGIISDLLAVNPDFARAHPDAIVGALRAWGDAMRFYRSHTGEAQAIIAKNVGAKPADLKESFRGVELYDLKQSVAFMKSKWLPLAAQVLTILKTQGSLKSHPNVKAATDASYLRKAVGAK